MPSFIEFAGHGGPKSKIHISRGWLPPYVDAAQPPTKKSPWRQIREVPFIHTVSVLMPEAIYDMVWQKLDDEVKKVEYAKVIMKLQEILEEEFFTEYIKKGNILMLSEGQAGVDNIFSLQQGTLRLDLDKQSYERAGLQGRPVESGGRKHTKARYLVEVDLRQPSMLHGKKGFERFVWAAKNVLNQSCLWLFLDIAKLKTAPASMIPLKKHQPTCLEYAPSVQVRKDVAVHNALHALIRDTRGMPVREEEEDYHELVEWIDEVVLGLDEALEVKVKDDPEPNVATTTLRVLTVQGLLSPEWVTNLLISML